MKPKSSGKDEDEPEIVLKKERSLSVSFARSLSYITADDQKEGHKTGHQIMSLSDIGKAYRDHIAGLTEAEREAELLQTYTAEELRESKKGTSPDVAFAYLLETVGFI
ncbi:hypothetical protein FSARC_13181 [Fusarium sarcochroum]|uniref:Uncharacterized protein n=1 Tax=Fusarium sarcochroum TaxID=1208366 RepID=A0A8H4T351_9HYPO|nr:hypothetical protein FSARC_13181 [Fusarium sarcochroum]